MDLYLIVRADGAYVTRPGSKRSYTKDLKDARLFPTRKAASDECCENEHVSTVADEMNPARV